MSGPPFGSDALCYSLPNCFRSGKACTDAWTGWRRDPACAVAVEGQPNRGYRKSKRSANRFSQFLSVMVASGFSLGNVTNRSWNPPHPPGNMKTLGGDAIDSSRVRNSRLRTSSSSSWHVWLDPDRLGWAESLVSEARLLSAGRMSSGARSAASARGPMN